MSDVRDIIREDRGWIKKIQAFLPGYKKYRNCEDLRSADNIVRMELAKRLRTMEQNISDAREDIARKMDLENLNMIGELANRSHTLTEKVRHAEHGYSPWISGDVRIEEDELTKLYDYDLSLFEDVESLIAMSKTLSDATSGNGTNVRDHIKSMSGLISDFDRTFSARISVVTKVAQRPEGKR